MVETPKEKLTEEIKLKENFFKKEILMYLNSTVSVTEELLSQLLEPAIKNIGGKLIVLEDGNKIKKFMKKYELGKIYASSKIQKDISLDYIKKGTPFYKVILFFKKIYDDYPNIDRKKIEENDFLATIGTFGIYQLLKDKKISLNELYEIQSWYDVYDIIDEYGLERTEKSREMKAKFEEQQTKYMRGYDIDNNIYKGVDINSNGVETDTLSDHEYKLLFEDESGKNSFSGLNGFLRNGLDYSRKLFGYGQLVFHDKNDFAIKQQFNVGNCHLLGTLHGLRNFSKFKEIICKSIIKIDGGRGVKMPLGEQKGERIEVKESDVSSKYDKHFLENLLYWKPIKQNKFSFLERKLKLREQMTFPVTGPLGIKLLEIAYGKKMRGESENPIFSDGGFSYNSLKNFLGEKAICRRLSWGRLRNKDVISCKEVLDFLIKFDQDKHIVTMTKKSHVYIIEDIDKENLMITYTDSHNTSKKSYITIHQFIIEFYGLQYAEFK